MLVSDLTHFLHMPVDAPSPARRMADRLGRIVSAATAGDVGDPWTSAIRCDRRAGRRPCDGFIAVVRQTATSPIRWRCTTCDDEGVISGWEGSPYDLRQGDIRAAEPQLGVRLDPEGAATLQGILVLDHDCLRLVWRARVVGDEVQLAGSHEDMAELAGYVASESNHETKRPRQRQLDAVLDVLEQALADSCR